MIINIFNPNLREIKGIFFVVPEQAVDEFYGLKNDTSTKEPDLKPTEADFEPLKIEKFCSMG